MKMRAGLKLNRQQRAEVWPGEQLEVTESEGVEEERRRGDRHDASREAVEAVDQIDGLGHAEQPKHRDHRLPVTRQKEHVEEGNTEIEHRRPEHDQHEGGDDDPGHLRWRRQIAGVIEEAGGEHDHRGDEHPERLGAVGEHLPERIGEGGHPKGGHQSDEHRQSPRVRDRDGVHAPLVRRCHPAPRHGQRGDERGRDERHPRRDEADDHVGGE